MSKINIIMDDNFIRVLVKWAVNTMRQEGYDTERGWQKVSHRIQAGKKRSVLFSFWRYAAVFVVGVSAMTLFFVMKDGEQHPEVAAETGGEVSKQVELILADGQRMPLEGRVQDVEIDVVGATATVSDGQKQLSYRRSAAGDSPLRYNTLRVPEGGEYRLMLSDGTKVWINSGSEIRFPVAFSGAVREVFLKGEAYFEVAHDGKMPFHVRAGNEDIKVLGTRFNVSAYPEDRMWHTTLVEGSVSVAVGNERVVLTPSHQFRMNSETGISEVRKVETDLFTSWMSGKIYFKNTSLEEIMLKLQRWYDVKVFYVQEDLKEMKFRGSIDKYESVGEALQRIGQTTDIHFELKGDVVTVMKVYKQ